MSLKIHPSGLDYRADIDGLRAIAVLSVIVFHIEKSILPGGFVGVDIFFVISGYLISLLLYKEIEGGRFSLVDFYRRRVQRIVPAMLVVVGITLIISQLVLHPADAERAAESALWSLFSIGNVYFWYAQDTSYFAAQSSQFPLLHLWSLGVEEQFYLVWPLLLILLFRRLSSIGFIALVLSVTCLSFITGQYTFNIDPAFAYYMLPTRAGELLIGALTAYYVFINPNRDINNKLSFSFAFIGAALILGSLFALNENMVFPGFNSIPPVLGCAALILAGHFGSNLITRVLTFRAMVWVGLISYSAYLWHWPVLAFYRYGQFDITPLTGSIIFITTFCLAWLSYRYIETPCRKWSKTPISIFIWQYIFPTSVLVFIAIFSMKIDGYGVRWNSAEYKNEVARVNNHSKPANEYSMVCQSKKLKAEDAINPLCVKGVRSGQPPKTILIGDSNAAHYVGMLSVFAENSQFSFRNLQVGSCPPVSTDPAPFVTAVKVEDCRESAPIMWPEVAKYQKIILAANWPEYQKNNDQFLSALDKTVAELTNHGKKVVLLSKIPVVKKYDRHCKEKALSFPFMQCSYSGEPLSDDIKEINLQINDIAEKYPNASFFDVTKYICPGNICSVESESNVSRYYDSSHLSMHGSRELGKKIVLIEGVPMNFATDN